MHWRAYLLKRIKSLTLCNKKLNNYIQTTAVYKQSQIIKVSSLIAFQRTKSSKCNQSQDPLLQGLKFPRLLFKLTIDPGQNSYKFILTKSNMYFQISLSRPQVIGLDCLSQTLHLLISTIFLEKNRATQTTLQLLKISKSFRHVLWNTNKNIVVWSLKYLTTNFSFNLQSNSSNTNKAT